MPGADGRETLAAIKNDPELRRIPVIVLSTSQAEDDIRDSYDLHANCYLTKPSGFDDLVAMVKALHEVWLVAGKVPAA